MTFTSRMTVALVAATASLATAVPAVAQSRTTIPIEQDLRRYERIEERIEARREPRPDEIGPYARPVDPGNVPGFNGPPGMIGDSVNSFDPLPQGAAGNDIR